MRLTPRNTQFYDMFAAAADNVLDAALVLKELLNAAPDQRPELARQLRDLEHVGDQATHDIMRALNTSFITPFDREDIAVLAAGLDDVVDDIEAAGDLTVLYKIGVLPQAVHEQAELLEEAARVTTEGIGRLRTCRSSRTTGSGSTRSRTSPMRSIARYLRRSSTVGPTSSP
jgi:uncharacterized protein Yka (UPF0111/DUF47 family)